MKHIFSKSPEPQLSEKYITSCASADRGKIKIELFLGVKLNQRFFVFYTATRHMGSAV